MPKISLTQFLNYANAKDPAAKIVILRTIKKQFGEKYNPNTDFYKQIRDSILSSKGKEISNIAVDPRKQIAFDEIVKSWNEFVKAKEFKPVNIRRKEWTHDDLIVYVNPELAFEYEGKVTFYKLWFKTDIVTKRNAGIIYQIMHEMLEPEINENISIFDIRHRKIVDQPSLLPSNLLSASLRAEANHFLTLWPAI
jgi:hypothetical protein